jgi:hypothetical protein
LHPAISAAKLSDVELADVEAFLILAEELHFGRTASRTYVSPARVSQRPGRVRRRQRRSGAAPAHWGVLPQTERCRCSTRTINDRSLNAR